MLLVILDAIWNVKHVQVLLLLNVTLVKMAINYQEVNVLQEVLMSDFLSFPELIQIQVGLILIMELILDAQILLEALSRLDLAFMNILVQNIIDRLFLLFQEQIIMLSVWKCKFFLLMNGHLQELYFFIEIQHQTLQSGVGHMILREHMVNNFVEITEWIMFFKLLLKFLLMEEHQKIFI